MKFIIFILDIKIPSTFYYFIFEPSGLGQYLIAISYEYSKLNEQFTTETIEEKKKLTHFYSCWTYTVFLACISLLSFIFLCTFSPYTTYTTLICWSNPHTLHICVHIQEHCATQRLWTKVILTCSLSWSLLAVKQTGMYSTILLAEQRQTLTFPSVQCNSQSWPYSRKALTLSLETPDQCLRFCEKAIVCVVQ